MDQPTLISRFFEAFRRHDYAFAEVFGGTAFANGTSYDVGHAYAICLLRIGQADRGANVALRIMQGHASISGFWYASLLALSFGQLDPAELGLSATTPSRRCEFQYYLGARYLTLKQRGEALREFRACEASGVDCHESTLARAEIAFLSSGAPEPINDIPPLQMNDVALSLFARGRHREAIPLLEQAAASFARYFSADLQVVVASYINLGAAYRTLGNFSDAWQSWRTGLTFAEKNASLRRERAVLLTSLADLGIYAGTDPREVSCLFEQAIDLLRGVHDATEHLAGALNGYGKSMLVAGAPELAEKLLEEALTLRLEKLGSRHQDTARSLWALAALPASARALGRAREALSIRREAPVHARELVESLTQVAELSPDSAEAVDRLREAVAMQRDTDFEPAVKAKTLWALFRRLVAANAREEALACARQAVGLDEKIIVEHFALRPDSKRTIWLACHDYGYRSVMHFMYEHAPHVEAAIRLAFVSTVRWKSITGEVLRSERETAMHAGAEGAARSAAAHAELRVWRGLVGNRRAYRETALLPGLGRHELGGRILALAKLASEASTALAGKGKAIALAHEADIESARRVRDRVLKRIEAFSYENIVAFLPHATTLVEFARFVVEGPEPVDGSGHRYIAFALTAGSPLRLVDLGPVQEIDGAIHQYLAAISDANNSDRGSPAEARAEVEAERVRRIVFDPLGLNAGSSEHVILAPLGALSLFSFDALPDGLGGHLLDRYCFSYVASAAELIPVPRPLDVQPKPCVVVGAPDFDRIGPAQRAANPNASIELGSPFAPLEDAKREAIEVGSLLGVAPWLGEEALKARLLAVRSPVVLHMATEAYFRTYSVHPSYMSPEEKGVRYSRSGVRAGASEATEDVLALLGELENPLLRCGLILAGANTWLQTGFFDESAQEGLFTGEDVLGIDLRGTELVVLAACETGVGETSAQDSSFDLPRAFRIAGAKATICARWQVADDSTRMLMRALYEALLTGVSKAEALRRAKQAVRKTFPHARDWGAFVCYGHAGPINMCLVRDTPTSTAG